MISKIFGKKKSKLPELKNELMDKMLELEERIFDQDFTEEIIFQITEIYSIVVDYCESVGSPLKKYFREKISNLYLKKEVIKLLLKDEKDVNNAIEEIGNNSFLKFSEIQYENVSPAKTEKKFMNSENFDKEKNYENYKIKKNVNAMMMCKVKDEMIKEKQVSESQEVKTFSQFSSNDNLIKNTLNNQFSQIQDKLMQRKRNSMIKDTSKKNQSLLQSNNNIKDLLLSNLEKDKNDKNLNKILDSEIDYKETDKKRKSKVLTVLDKKNEDFNIIEEEEEFDYDISQITTND